MLKFLRKYNKWILAVGGCLLMVAFLLPQALTSGASGMNNPKIGRVDGRTLRAADRQLAAAKLQIIEASFNGIPVFLNDSQDKPLHWLLMVEEARSRGYIGGPRDGATLAAAIDDIRREALYSRFGPALVNETFAEAQGVFRLVSMLAGAYRLSEPEARQVAREIFSQADVDAFVIRADALLDEVPEPTEEQVTALYEANRDVRRGAGEHGFGYRLDAAVKVEWIVLNRPTISGAITPDPIEVRKRWQSARERFPGEFAEERAAVEDEIRSERTETVFREVDQVIRGAALQELRQYPESGRWRTLPEDWNSKVTSLELLAFTAGQRIEEMIGRMVTPGVLRRDRWLTTPELSTLPGIARAAVPVGARALPFPMITTETREIAGDTARGPQVGVLYGPITDTVGNAYYYRLLDARKEGPPASLDAVREEVVRDARRLAAFRLLQDQVDVIRQRVLAEGLEPVAQDVGDTTVVQGVVTRLQVSGLAPEMNVEEFRTAVNDAASAIDPTKPVAETPAEARTIVQELEQSLSVGVAQIVGLTPLTREVFVQFAPQLDLAAARLEQQEADAAQPFDFASVARRVNFRPTDPEAFESLTAGAAEPADTPG